MGTRDAELSCFMQTSTYPGRKIRGLSYHSVSIEDHLIATVTHLAASVVGGKVRCVLMPSQCGNCGLVSPSIM